MEFQLLPLPFTLLFFPLHLISLAIRYHPIRRPILFLLILSLSSSIIAHSYLKPSVPHDLHQTVCRGPENDAICELKELRLKIARLESLLEENIKQLNTKSVYIEEKEKQIEETAHKVQLMQNALVTIKKLQDDSLYVEERINALEEEVRLLWAVSRKNNFDLHNLQSKACDAGEKLEILTSQVEKMENVVTERWIQIRQLEQALQITKVRTLEANRKAESSRCMLLKFILDFRGHHLHKIMRVLGPNQLGNDFILSSYMSQAWQHFKRIMSAAQKYHHELQGSVKEAMERYEFTAALANEELVFFVASAIITFPVMSAWIFYASHFG